MEFRSVKLLSVTVSKQPLRKIECVVQKASASLCPGPTTSRLVSSKGVIKSHVILKTTSPRLSYCAPALDAASICLRKSARKDRNRYQRNKLVPQVRPAPKPHITTRSPRLMRPSRLASSRAIGMEAADVLPTRSRLL